MTRALIVDDSPTQAEELRFILEAAALLAETRPSGERALERLATGGIDIVLSDIVMPGIDGYELCRQVKRKWPDLPVVLLTTLSDPAEVIRALECGADGFLTKPYEPEHLVERVRGVVDSRALRARTDAGTGVSVAFLGQHFTVSAHPAQILGLLVSTFEDMVRRNQELTIAKAQLADKHETALRLQRQKEELSSLIVHDLRSPAAGILMSARAKLRDPGVSEAQARYWRVVYSSAEVINRMVMNLLDIASGDEGILSPKVADVDVSALVSEVQDLMAPLASDRGHRVVIDATPGLSPVSIDRELIRRVIQNLVDNAIRHSPPGSDVRIEAAIDGDGLVLRVRDQGPGVPVEIRTRIFDRYVRGEFAGHHDDFGKGLGLAFCRMAVEAHGGRIWVEDNDDAGSVFVIRVPLAGV